jgi:hypothetical protein
MSLEVSDRSRPQSLLYDRILFEMMPPPRGKRFGKEVVGPDVVGDFGQYVVGPFLVGDDAATRKKFGEYLRREYGGPEVIHLDWARTPNNPSGTILRWPTVLSREDLDAHPDIPPHHPWLTHDGRLKSPEERRSLRADFILFKYGSAKKVQNGCGKETKGSIVSSPSMWRSEKWSRRYKEVRSLLRTKRDNWFDLMTLGDDLDICVESEVKAVLEGIISKIEMDPRAGVENASTFGQQNQDTTQRVCSDIISEIISKVEEIISEVTLESETLDWLSGYRTKSPSPSEEEVNENLRYASKLLTNKPAFAQKLCALEESAELFVALADRGSWHAMVCIDKAMRRVPDFIAEFRRVSGVYGVMLRTSIMHTPTKTFEKSGMSVVLHMIASPRILKSLLLPSEEAAAWMALLFAETGMSNTFTRAIFNSFDDATKVQVCECVCIACDAHIVL